MIKKLCFLALILTTPLVATAQTRTKGILLEKLTWIEAEKVLKQDTIVRPPKVA